MVLESRTLVLETELLHKQELLQQACWDYQNMQASHLRQLRPLRAALQRALDDRDTTIDKLSYHSRPVDGSMVYT